MKKIEYLIIGAVIVIVLIFIALVRYEIIVIHIPWRSRCVPDCSSCLTDEICADHISAMCPHGCIEIKNDNISKYYGDNR